MYKANVNKGNNYNISYTEKEITLNNNLFEWDIFPVSSNLFHVLHKGKSYRLEIVNIQADEKKFILKVNGHKIEIKLHDRYDLLLEKLGMTDLVSQKINQVQAPMPGLILDIKVAEGNEVKKGDPIMILEAMKMENIIKSPGEGIVKAIKVKKGDSVEKNQVLILF